MSKYSTDHTVYINSKGVEVPSVTTVLKIIEKPALAKWANYLGYHHQSVDAVLKDSAAIGTDFHDMVSKYTMGEQIDGEHIDDAITLFGKFQKWEKDNGYHVLISEQSLTNDSFGGTIDAVGFINDELCMVDYKTSKSIYPSMFLQLSGYSLLVKKNMPDTYKKLKKFGILSVSIKNNVQSKFISKKELETQCVPVFNNALKLFHSWFDMNESMFDINIAK